MKLSEFYSKHPFGSLSVVLALLLLVASSVAIINFRRTLKKVVAWEHLLEVMMRVGEYLQSNTSIELSNSIATPTEVTEYGIVVLSKWPNMSTEDKLLLDAWGSPMHFYAIRINDKVYLKGISAGPDRVFNTQDDIINSEFDDTGTIFPPRNYLKNNK